MRRNEIPAIPRHPKLHLFPTVMQLHLRMRYGFFPVNQHAHRAVTTPHPHPLLLGIQPAEHLDVRGFQEILQEQAGFSRFPRLAGLRGFRKRRCRCLLSIKNVEKDIVFFGLRRGCFYHQPTYPFALRQDKKPHFAAICQDFLRDIFRASETDGASRCEMVPPVGEAQVFGTATPSAPAQDAEISAIRC